MNRLMYTWFRWGRWVIWALIAAGFIWLLSPPAWAGEEFDLDRITVAETGQPFQLRWCHPEGQDGEGWAHTVQILEFPPKESQQPTATHTANGSATTWDYTPRKAGVFYVQARSCNPAGVCSPWGLSIEQNGADVCATDPKHFIYYFKLANISQGGID